ncbi:hypothetical protein SAY87_014751 [Trapa incisa]|uniref:non-specific serine/threonine protein kinase n=1 Tax=Trapa incisa TaxID=236973 RepID=A0AAN7JLD2_9MYRT|nr:hypothetical protein SAY87_014751 [Trapa incisa]
MCLLPWLGYWAAPRGIGSMEKTTSKVASLWSFLVFLSLFVSVRVYAVNYVPTDQYLLNCGGNSEVPDFDDRKWTPDIGSSFLSSTAKSSIAEAAQQASTVSIVPFMTARLFHSDFTYTFPVSPGHKFIRLYFYPSTYNKLSPTDAIFSVTAGPYILLKNFSAAQTAEALNYDYVIKEYSLNTVGNTLSITFSPSKDYQANKFAFVNGIEIVSMPDIYNTVDGKTMIVGTQSSLYVDNTTALEHVYRLNVGGQSISASNDTGMYRVWSADTPYIYGAAVGVTGSQNITVKYPSSMPTYIAPDEVYQTARSMGPNPTINLNFNLTWIFSIDSGFSYLMRLHFCELAEYVTRPNDRRFLIYISNQTAETEADIVQWTGSNEIPTYKDYGVFVPTGGPQQDLWLALYPQVSQRPTHTDVILNGVEIFKINDTNGNLAGPNPIPATNPTSVDLPPSGPSGGSGKSKSPVAAIAGGVGGGVALALVISFLVVAASRRRRRDKDLVHAGDSNTKWLPLPSYGDSKSAISAKPSTTGSYASSLPSNICRHFSFAEIEAATDKFDEALLLGVGGFGKVYRGEIDGGTTKVAIKRGNPLSQQGVHEFQTEIEMLSKLRHMHLVSLIGYCEENNEMILVYDYMAQGTLREHLYKHGKPPLSWKQRLEICIGSARGLHYLHTGAKHPIIHRDVKTTNILLDEKWVAKVSDFGLSKTGPTLDHTHVSTVVKGSFGYLDPEYYRRQQLTDKSDVYSFGVVLFEILCARPALNSSLPKEQTSLAEWASSCHKKGILDQIIDPFLKGRIAPECFRKFAETAMKCVEEAGINRPSMGEVLWSLEFALQLQESAEDSGTFIGAYDEAAKGKMDPNAPPGLDSSLTTDSRTSCLSTTVDGQSIASDGTSSLLSNAVFSQIMDPRGR